MTNLRLLWISRCHALKAIPDGLKFVNSLESLSISNMSPELKEKIRTREGGDFHNISHIPKVRLDSEPL